MYAWRNNSDAFADMTSSKTVNLTGKSVLATKCTFHFSVNFVSKRFSTLTSIRHDHRNASTSALKLTVTVVQMMMMMMMIIIWNYVYKV
jgi:hypothetical protein